MDKKYCPACGQDVPLERSLEGKYLLICCEYCGLGLGVQLASAEVVRQYQSGEAGDSAEQPSLARVDLKKQTRQIVAAVEKPVRNDPRSIGTSSDWSFGAIPRLDANGAEAPPAAEKTPARRMKRVMVVEDSDFLRTVTRDILTERQLAREVIDSPDGQAFLEEFSRLAAAGKKPDLVILDVRMPGLDGREAAFALRSIENAFGAKRTPILFFSAMLCDADFKQTLKEIRNARYIRKADEDPQQLGERIATVLERLVDGARAKA